MIQYARRKKEGGANQKREPRGLGDESLLMRIPLPLEGRRRERKRSSRGAAKQLDYYRPRKHP